MSPEVSVSTPRGSLLVELTGEGFVEAEEVVFWNATRGLRDGEVYIGPNYNFYDEAPPDKGRLVEPEKLGAMKPGHGANEVTAHGYRHTDWVSGTWARSIPGERALAVESSRWSGHPDVTKWPWGRVGSLNAGHDEHGVEETFAMTDFEAAADLL